jgi:hypothetical protein
LTKIEPVVASITFGKPPPEAIGVSIVSELASERCRVPLVVIPRNGDVGIWSTTRSP